MKEDNEIKKLDDCSFPDIKWIPDGYHSKQIPEATPENMVVMMDKINELTEVINNFVEFSNRFQRK